MRRSWRIRLNLPGNLLRKLDAAQPAQSRAIQLSLLR